MFKKLMSFEAESNSELTVIVPAYQLHFRFPVENKIHPKKICRTPRPAYLAVLQVLVIFCPLGPTNFKKSALIEGPDGNVDLLSLIKTIIS